MFDRVFRDYDPISEGNYGDVQSPPVYECEGDRFNAEYCEGCENYDLCKAEYEEQNDN